MGNFINLKLQTAECLIEKKGEHHIYMSFCCGHATSGMTRDDYPSSSHVARSDSLRLMWLNVDMIWPVVLQYWQIIHFGLGFSRNQTMEFP